MRSINARCSTTRRRCLRANCRRARKSGASDCRTVTFTAANSGIIRGKAGPGNCRSSRTARFSSAGTALTNSTRAESRTWPRAIISDRTAWRSREAAYESSQILPAHVRRWASAPMLVLAAMRASLVLRLPRQPSQVSQHHGDSEQARGEEFRGRGTDPHSRGAAGHPPAAGHHISDVPTRT